MTWSLRRRSVIRWSAGSSPARPTSGAIFKIDLAESPLIHRYADGAVQQIGYLGLHRSAANVAVLGRRDVGTAEMVSADPRRAPFIIDEGGHRLAETMSDHRRNPKLLGRGTRLLGEIVRVPSVPAVDGKITSCSPR
jgi:hypothetical protein